jgi:hypothetical protein
MTQIGSNGGHAQTSRMYKFGQYLSDSAIRISKWYCTVHLLSIVTVLTTRAGQALYQLTCDLLLVDNRLAAAASGLTRLLSKLFGTERRLLDVN